MYKIIGQDGKEYGPVTAGQIKQWIAENRVERRTPIFMDGASDWNFAGLLPEFAGLFSANPPTIAPPKTGTTGTNSFAVAGMIFGILAFVCCFKFLFSALGITFSLIGLSQINRHPERYEGRGFAIAGIVLSASGLLFALLLVIFFLATGHFHTQWNIGHF